MFHNLNPAEVSMAVKRKSKNEPTGSYHVVKFEKTKFFEKRVSELIDMGWVLHGSPFMDRVYHCQVLVKGK